MPSSADAASAPDSNAALYEMWAACPTALDVGGDTVYLLPTTGAPNATTTTRYGTLGIRHWAGAAGHWAGHLGIGQGTRQGIG